MKHSFSIAALCALIACTSFSCTVLSAITTEATGISVGSTSLSDGIKGSEVFIDGRSVEIYLKWASDHEVTQGEWYEIMGRNPSHFKKAPAKGEIQENRPVEQVSWYDAIVYCNRLSIHEHRTPCYSINGEVYPSQWGSVPHSQNDEWDNVVCDFSASGYRLPTEAEWEYLARGGNRSNSGQTYYSGSNRLDDVAWNDVSKTHEVKKKDSNGYGIYDMSGNVEEWCWDWYTSRISAGTPSTGPSMSESFGNRVIRGGSINSFKSDCEVSARKHDDPSYYNSSYRGFRVVRSSRY